MKLSALFDTNLIRCEVEVGTKEEVLKELTQLYEEYEDIPASKIMDALIERERKGPFSIVENVAMPHARIDEIKDFKVAMCTLKNPVDFKFPKDAKNIKVVLLFLVPKTHSSIYLHAVATFLSFFSVGENLRRILDAKDPDEIIKVFDTYSPHFKGYEIAKDVASEEFIPASQEATVEEILRLMQRGYETIPIIDEEENLVGEVVSKSILKLGVNEFLGFLSNSAYLRDIDIFENFLENYGKKTLSEMPELVLAPQTIQEDEPIINVVAKFLSGKTTHIYVLRERKLTGVITPSGFIQRLARIK
jgi:PTS system nitrogen regulatory IIA component